MKYPKKRLNLDTKISEIFYKASTNCPDMEEFLVLAKIAVKKLIQNNYRRRVR